jgi:putative hydrolase of the HAD superfamily
MPYKAVIFDLFGTLIDESADDYAAMMARMAELLDVPLDELYETTSADADARNLGVYESVAHQFHVMCGRLGVAPDAAHLTGAIDAYTELQRARLVPREDVLDTLRKIGERGFKQGLISNASQVIVDLWPRTAFGPYFEHVVLSWAVKVTKPDPAIYRLCYEALGVEPGDCLFVGDGGSDELTGAEDAGMHAVLIALGYDDRTALGATRQQWGGDVISSIPDVLGLLES